MGNRHASGTRIIAKLGEEHMRGGKPICYTTACSRSPHTGRASGSVHAVSGGAPGQAAAGRRRLWTSCALAYLVILARGGGPLCGGAAGEIAKVNHLLDTA